MGLQRIRFINKDGQPYDMVLNIIKKRSKVIETINTEDGSREDSRIHFYESPERYQNYGHPNRRSMLKAIECNPSDFILMTNDDNYYVPRFVAYMLHFKVR